MHISILVSLFLMTFVSNDMIVLLGSTIVLQGESGL